MVAIQISYKVIPTVLKIFRIFNFEVLYSAIVILSNLGLQEFPKTTTRALRVSKSSIFKKPCFQMPISDNKTQPCSYSTYMYGDKAGKRADATTEL